MLDRLSNQDGAIQGRKSAHLSQRSLIDTDHVSLRMNLCRVNVVCGMRQELIHLHGSSHWRRHFRSHVNPPAAYVPAGAFAALPHPLCIAPAEHHCEPQTKTPRSSSLSCAFFHNWQLYLAHRLFRHDRVNRPGNCDSTQARKTVQMTIVYCDEGPRTTGFSKSSSE